MKVSIIERIDGQTTRRTIVFDGDLEPLLLNRFNTDYWKHDKLKKGMYRVSHITDDITLIFTVV